MGILNLLKNFPVDLGQGSMRYKTKGKLIAFDFISSVDTNENRSENTSENTSENNKAKKALDVGCREGHQTELLEKKGYEVTSIDIEKAYDKCTIADANKKLPFKNSSFDVIWCSEVIEHLDNPDFSAGELRRVLKPGGIMVLTTPNSYFWLMKLVYLFGLSPQKLQRADHKHFFNEKNIRKVFPDAEIYGFFPYFLLKMKIKRLVGFLSPTFVICEKK